MDAPTTGGEYSRNPTIDDLVELCRHLNTCNARYVIIGGFAMIHHGYVRTTADIDLLVESDESNVARIKAGLMYLPDKAAREIEDGDVRIYTVVRISDEIVIDLLSKACEVSFDDAKHHVEVESIRGVNIPYVTAEVLLKTKQGLRAQDVQDRMYLEQLLNNRRSRSETI